MKNLMYAVIVIVALVWLWHVLDKDGRASRAVENAVENAGLAMEEKSLAGEPAVIRKSMLDQRERDNREWTAENIAKHPDLYLNHCGKTLARFKEQYEAAIIGANSTINLYRREISDAQEASAPLLGFLKEAKTALSDKKLEFPAKIGVFTYADAEKLKEAVVATDAKLSELEQLRESRKGQIERLQQAHSDLVKGRDRVKKELRELDGRIAQAKARNLGNAVDGLNARMNALLGSIDATPGAESALPGAVAAPSAAPDVEDVFSRRGIE